MKALFTFACAGVIVGPASAAFASSDPVQQCQTIKSYAAEDRAICLSIEHVKDLSGQAPNFQTCEDRFDAIIAIADAFAGQQGTACRFVDNHDGTISDLNALLMWEKKDNSSGLHDYRTTYAWSTAPWWAQWFAGQSGDGKSITGSFAGHSDWRVPTFTELQSMLLPTCGGAPICVDPVFSNGVDSFTAASDYWSSITYAPNPAGSAWSVSFVTGAVQVGDTGFLRPVRLVRGSGRLRQFPVGAVVIGFDGLTANGSPVSGYAESGVTVAAVSGPWVASTTYGNPAPFIQFRASAGNTVSGGVRISTGGSVFTFYSVDLYSSTTPIPYTITGLRNGSVVFTLTDTVANTFGKFRTVANANPSLGIDTLSIVLTNAAATCCDNPVGLDTIVLKR